ncbi:Xylosyltransferase 2 [Phlyctochytrium planicorne]|nr:Xylosyltransferase 2 [Phlyctochytrium planicorne]
MSSPYKTQQGDTSEWVDRERATKAKTVIALTAILCLGWIYFTISTSHMKHPSDDLKYQNCSNNSSISYSPIIVDTGKDSKSGIYAGFETGFVANVEQSNDQFFRAYGFQFCTMLNEATFNGIVEISKFGGSVADVNPKMSAFTEMIDEEARKARDRLVMEHSFFDKEDVKRFACYATAEGNNAVANLTSSRLLHTIDPKIYLNPVLPALETTKVSRIPGPRRKYRLAYLLMVHGDPESLKSIKTIVEALDDGSSILLIHVDGGSERLYEAVESWLAQRDDDIGQRWQQKFANDTNNNIKPSGNVYLARYRYIGQWGHISLVWMQLSGFWELQDLADWDYVINLSGSDYPLRASREIHRVLSLQHNAGKNFIEFWRGHWPGQGRYDTAIRMAMPQIARADHLSYEMSMFSPVSAGLMYPSFRHWKLQKHNQWVILSADFIKYLRVSVDALDALAFMEHTSIPDEQYIGAVIANAPIFKDKIVDNMKRFLQFPPGQAHPATLDMGWTSAIGEDNVGDEPRYFFARKINILSEDGEKLIEWIKENHIKKHTLADDGYGTLEGKEFVA